MMEIFHYLLDLHLYQTEGAGSNQANLVVGEFSTYTATYTISQAAAYTSSVKNRVCGYSILTWTK